MAVASPPRGARFARAWEALDRHGIRPAVIWRVDQLDPGERWVVLEADGYAYTVVFVGLHDEPWELDQVLLGWPVPD